MSASENPVVQAIPLWYAEMAWAKELIRRSFALERADDILRPELRGTRPIPATNWFLRTHGIGVDVFKTPEVGGIDFDFDKPDPDPWRLKIFIERQVNEGNLPYEPFRAAFDDEALMDRLIHEALSSNA
jgi:hypothetical protein